MAEIVSYSHIRKPTIFWQYLEMICWEFITLSPDLVCWRRFRPPFSPTDRTVHIPEVLKLAILEIGDEGVRQLLKAHWWVESIQQACLIEYDAFDELPARIAFIQHGQPRSRASWPFSQVYDDGAVQLFQQKRVRLLVDEGESTLVTFEMELCSIVR